ncbi:MAG: DNA translocase FtsK 4TM domain-containing protein, partial [Proteobacteria bacterium]|nr:DNA translocase FtsK 4TM domain-containing protein [Pseudomonadota bacterium]
MSGDLKKEILGIGLLGIFIFLLVSLLSYNPFDPSLNTVAEGAAKNLCGKVGSYISDLLIQVFGMMSYFLSAFILLFSIFYIRKKEPPHPLIIAAGLILLFLSLSSFLQIMIGKIQLRGVLIPFSGFLGLLLQKTLINLFSYFGSYLISIILFLISLFLIIQAPLLSIVEKNIVRRKLVEHRKEIKVTEETKEEPKVEKKAVQETFEFFKDIGPYKLPPLSLLDSVEKKEV